MRYTNNQQGFTIIELLVAIVVLAILLPGVVTFFGAITATAGRATTTSLVNSYAENKIEGFRSAGFNSAPLTAGEVMYTGADALPVAVPSPKSATYQVDLPNPMNPAIKRLTIRVTYREYDTTETRTYVSYLGELGVGQ